MLQLLRKEVSKTSERKTMGTKLKPENKKTATVVETDRESRQPFSVLNRKAVLSRPEFEVFDAIREVAKNKYYWIIQSANWVVFLDCYCDNC